MYVYPQGLSALLFRTNLVWYLSAMLLLVALCVLMVIYMIILLSRDLNRTYATFRNSSPSTSAER